MRDAWLDNVKMTLVTVVVIGHSLPLFRADGWNSQLYDFIYFWHIPAFVLVTGYLSRSFAWTRRHLWSLFGTIVVPYVLFEAAMLAYRIWIGPPGNPLVWPDDAWLNPHWPMWYLAAVCLWRLATPLLKRHWVVVPASVAASLLFPVWGSDYLDLNRVVGLLPFFVLGLHARQAWLDRLKTRAAGAAGVGVLLSLLWLAGHTDQWLATKWLWYTFDYSHFGADLAEGMGSRAQVLALGLVGSLAVLSVIPRGRSWYTDMGAATMVVYLFHGFFIKAGAWWIHDSGHVAWVTTYADRFLLPVLAVAVGLALVLAWPPVARVLTWATDPIGSVQRARSRTRP